MILLAAILAALSLALGGGEMGSSFGAEQPSNSAMVEFPADVLFIVFSKLPIKSLMQFKCVSKKWNAIIGGDPCFAAMQTNNHNLEDTQALFLLGYKGSRFIERRDSDGSHVFKVDLNHLIDEFDVHTPEYTLEGSCNGLLLFKNYTDRVVWCNPLTQQIATFRCQAWRSEMQKLFESSKVTSSPYSQQDLYAKHGIGFDSLSNQYKIVRIYAERITLNGENFLFNVAAKVSNLEGIDLSWRDAKNFPVEYLSQRSVYASGCLHWTTRVTPRKIVISFLLDKEEFVSTPLPKESYKTDLVEISGLLGTFGQTSNNTISVWVKKEVVGEWIKYYDIDFTPMNCAYCWEIKVIGTWKNGQLLLLDNNGNTLFSYNKETDSMTRVEIPGLEFGTDAIIPMRGSIASISKFVQT